MGVNVKSINFGKINKMGDDDMSDPSSFVELLTNQPNLLPPRPTPLLFYSV